MEYNLDFLEACKALVEDRCRAIKSEGGCIYSKHKDRDVLVLDNCLSAGIMITAEEFLGKWRLVEIEPVKHKEVFEEVKWTLSRDREGGVIYPLVYGFPSVFFQLDLCKNLI